jgi:hypothetical protein
MTAPPAWTVDPAWPAVPDLPDDNGLEFDEFHDNPAPSEDAPLGADRLMAHQLAALHTERTRLLLRLHRAARRPAFALTASGAPTRKRGHPGHRARNDRLLALFEATPGHLPHLQRCRIAARLLAAQIAEAAGQPPERARVMPGATARDAIAEARRHRATLQPSSE